MKHEEPGEPLGRRVVRLWAKRGDRLNAVRRNVEMLIDQQWTLAARRWRSPVTPTSFDGKVRYALITVNFSTTHFLKLMLLTLIEQDALARIERLIVVDNDSRDGGRDFLRKLAARVPRLTLIENAFFPTHARGMRLGIDWLRQHDTPAQSSRCSNVLLCCDTDIIFRSAGTLGAVAERFSDPRVGFVGELRRHLYPYPEAQASFMAVRRDLYEHPSVAPMVHHGAPAYFMQRSLHQLGIELADFPSNFGGYILHRGRAGVEATRTFRPWDAHATAATHQAHYMGVPGGREIWAAVEQAHAHLLRPERERELLERLSAGLALLGQG